MSPPGLCKNSTLVGLVCLFFQYIVIAPNSHSFNTMQILTTTKNLLKIWRSEETSGRGAEWLIIWSDIQPFYLTANKIILFKKNLGSDTASNLQNN